jgi:3-deoxy-D-manno-octulosonate 8-phosphate phosphatase (KDO 8-P phosphatase)
MSQLELFNQIDTFIFDVDGVLTNGQLIVMNDGSLLRTMNIKDGYALQLAIKKGYKIIIISGGNSEVVKKRLAGLQVLEAHFAVIDKKTKLNEIILNNQLNLDTCLYMGDDMPDVAAMQTVALPCCPNDACTEVITASKYVSPIAGGLGCVRDVIEKVMKLRGDWE